MSHTPTKYHRTHAVFPFQFYFYICLALEIINNASKEILVRHKNCVKNISVKRENYFPNFIGLCPPVCSIFVDKINIRSRDRVFLFHLLLS